MLDDLNVIAQRDPDGALDIAGIQAEQLRHDFGEVEISYMDIKNVVVVGMGGSALAALVVKRWLRDRLKVPFEVYRDYDIPSYVDENTLLIASSYSGNTEETLEALGHAQEANAQIVIMASGGKLGDIAEAHGYLFFKIPFGTQPRYAVLFGVTALTLLFEQAGLGKDLMQELDETSEFLNDQAAQLLKDVPTTTNQAKKIALELAGKTPIIYGGPLMGPAAYKWKISFNENAKNVAYSNEFSELNHNEFMGWTSHPIDKPFGVVELRSNLEHPQIIKRFDVSNKVLSGMMPHPIEVQAVGETHLQQLLWTIQLGDFVSIYLALLNGVNPTPVKQIEQLKKELT